MDSKQQKSKETKLKFQIDTSKKGLILGSLIATIIATTPYLFNLYESVPDIKVWNTFLFTYDSNYYESIQVVTWTLLNKLIPLLLLFIWFFTCRHWWYHTLLVPISMYLYQAFIILNDDLQYVDNFSLLYLIPIMTVVIPSIYLIRARMFDKINSANKSLEELEEEFSMRPKTVWGKIKQYF